MIEPTLAPNTNKDALGTMPAVIIRLSQPSKLDHAPKGTLCLVDDGSTGNTYRQMSDDESDPVWIEM